MSRLKNNLWFSYIVFLLLWTGCVYNELGRMINAHELFAFEKDHHPYISDFVNLYNGATLAEACQREKIDIYSPVVQAEYEKKLTAPVVAEQPFYFQYPPFFFALVRPLAAFSITTAWFLWCATGMALLVGCAIYLKKAADFSSGKFTLYFIIIATLAAFPTWLSVKLGQTSMLLVPGLVAFWLLSQKRRFFLAGLAAGVVLIKLQYLPPIFIIGFLLGSWPFLGGFFTIGVILLLLSIFTVGIENTMRFPQALLSGESGKGVSGVAAEQMQNLRGMLTLSLGPDNPMVPIISIAFFALALIALFWMWWRVHKEDMTSGPAASRFRILASISTLLMLISSFHSHIQDYLLLVLPCIWLWFEIQKRQGDQVNGKEKFRLLRSLIILFPLLGWPFFVLLIFFQLAKIEPFFIWACLALITATGLYRSTPGEVIQPYASPESAT